MCGIAGVIKKGAGRLELEKIIQQMDEAQNLRGPDDRGFFVDEKVALALGHTRLSFIDLTSAGHQPMVLETINGNSKFVITFNGEIYNFLELRNELQKKGRQFETKTDTEVILAAFAEWGTESFSKLRGMFAFALWDDSAKKLYLVKDRYGIKPLYYYSDREKFIFASTVKALSSRGIVPDKKNEKAAIGFLLFGSVPLPHTTISGVSGMPAGYYLVRDYNGEEKLIKYYEPLNYFYGSGDNSAEKENVLALGYKSLVSEVRSLLEESVRLHMVSDAPLGVFLSGGVDSSVISILASRERQDPLTTLSITFDEAEYSEKKYQDLVASRIKSDHREYKITKTDFENSLSDIWDAMDQPTIDGVNTYFVAQAAKKVGLKAVLSGLGADEIFMGYPNFRRANQLRNLQLLVSKTFLRKGQFLGNILGDRWRKINYLKNGDVLSFYLAIRGLFDSREVGRHLDINISEVNNFIDSVFADYSLSDSRLNRMHPADLLSYLELKFYLQNQLLKDSDFMAMRHSIEIRVPFLDHVLVEYVSGLPAPLKLAGINPKQLLIDAVPELPGQIYNRPKMGFTFPFQKWLFESPDNKVGSSRAGTHWSRRWAKEVLRHF